MYKIYGDTDINVQNLLARDNDTHDVQSCNYRGVDIKVHVKLQRC